MGGEMATGIEKASTIGAALTLAYGGVVAETSMLLFGGLVGGAVLWALDDTKRPWHLLARDSLIGVMLAVTFGSLAVHVAQGMDFASDLGITSDLLWAPVAGCIAAFWPLFARLALKGIKRWKA